MFWLFLCVRTQLICEINNLVINNNNLTTSQCESYLWIGSSIPNFTSDGANLTITSSNITQDANSYLEGFSNIYVKDSQINTQCNSLNLFTIIFKNVTFVDQMQLNAQAISIYNSTIKKIHFVSQQTFQILYLQNVTFIDCLFYNTIFSSSQYKFLDLTLIGSTLVNSTLGSVINSSILKLINIKLVESTLFQIDNITNINLDNVQLSYSKLLIGQSQQINDITLFQCQLIASSILHLTNNQLISRLKIYNSFATNSFFNITSDYLRIQDIDIYNISAKRIFSLISLISLNLTMYSLKLEYFKSSLYFNNKMPYVQITDITITNSESNTFQSISGTLLIQNANLNNYSGIFINSSQSNYIQITNIKIFNYSSHNLVNISNGNLFQITNLQAQYIGYVPEDDQVILVFSKVANLKFFNTTFLSINDTQIFQMKQIDSTKMEQLQLVNSTFIRNNLIQANTSSLFISKLFINQVTINSNLFQIMQAQSFTIIQSRISQIQSSVRQALFLLNNINFIQINLVQFVECQNLLFYFKKSNVQFYNNTLDRIDSQMIILIYQGQFDAQNNIFRNVQYDLNRSLIQIYFSKLSDIIIFNNQFESIENKNYIQLTTNSIEAPNQQIQIDGPVYLSFNNQTYIINELLNNKSQIVIDHVRSSQNLSLIAFIQDSLMRTVCRQQDVVVFQDVNFVFDTFKCRWNIKYQFILDSPDNSTVILPINFTSLYQNDSNLLINLTINFLGCQLGEIWISNTCQRCQSGTYTYDRINCKDCPMSGQSCPGGAVIILRQGYWRPHNLTDNIAFCTISNNQCDGGSDNYTCQAGYVGAICSDCDYYKTQSSESYSYSVIWGCQKCNFDQKLTIEFIFAIFWMIISLIVSMKGTINLVRQQICAHYLKLGGFISGSRSMLFLDYSEILLKIFTTYFQLISIVSVAQIQYPPSFQNLTQIIGNPINALYYSTGCFLINLNLPIEIVYFRQIWNFIFTFSLVILLTIMYYLYILIMKIKDVKIINLYFIVLTQVYYQFQGDIIQGLLQIVFCLNASGDNYILASSQFQCYTDKHYFYQIVLVMPGLILTLIIFPAFYLYNLIQNRNRLWSYKFRQRYGYLISEYANTYFYWEFIKILMKNIFYLLQTLLIQEKKLLFLTAILILIAYQHLVDQKKPFVDGKFNRLETICAASAYITIILVFLQEYNQYNAVVIISNSVCGLLNIILVSYFIFQIVLEAIEELKKSYIHKIIILIKKYPCFGSIFRRHEKLILQDKRVAKLWSKLRQHAYKIINDRINRDLLEQQTRDEVRSSVELGRYRQNKSFDFKADNDISSLDRTERQFIQSDLSNKNVQQQKNINSTQRIKGRSYEDISSTLKLLQGSGILLKKTDNADKLNIEKQDAKVYPKFRKIKI